MGGQRRNPCGFQHPSSLSPQVAASKLHYSGKEPERAYKNMYCYNPLLETACLLARLLRSSARRLLALRMASFVAAASSETCRVT